MANLTQKINRELKCMLTDEEHKDYSMQLAEANVQHALIDSDRKAAASKFKADLDEKNKEIGELAKKVTDGFEYRQV